MTSPERMLRLIVRLDIKAPNLIKGIHFEGLRVLGNPHAFAESYYNQGADEFLYIDAVASLYERNTIAELVSSTARNIFVPLTVGGGVRTLVDAEQVFRSGADKVAINTAAVRDPEIITQLAKKFGSQAVVLSVDAKRCPMGGWEVLVEGGREHTGLDVIEWVIQGVSRGAGEILLTSIDRDGTKSGFDIELASAVACRLSTPLIVSGGMGNLEHLLDLANAVPISGVAIGSVLHYNILSLPVIRKFCVERGLPVRSL